MSKVTKNTAKEKKIFTLPDEYKKVVYQPNYIVHAQYSYTVIQERVFNYIIWYLQKFVKEVMNGKAVRQLDMFASPNEEYIDIDIPLWLIGKPRQYPEIRARVLQMIQVPVKVEVTKGRKGNMQRFDRMQSWITHVDIPQGETKRRMSVLPIRISKAVASLMVDVDHDGATAFNYTSFCFNIALLADNKYTSRIYKLISSYKRPADEPHAVKSFEYQKFREILQIGEKYTDYEAFKRCVLVPVQKELKEGDSDICFELSETRDNRKRVTKLNFVIKHKSTEDSSLTECKLWNSIISRLQNQFGCDKGGIESVIPKLKERAAARAVLDSMAVIMAEYLDRLHDPQRRVHNLAAYTIGSLKRNFL